jgi:hypothetical protein
LYCSAFTQAQKKQYWLIDTETKVRKKVKDSTSAVKFWIPGSELFFHSAEGGKSKR